MQYLLLIYVDEAEFAVLSADAVEQVLEAYGAYNRALADAGVLRARAMLRQSTTAATVTVRDGLTTITDGPFAGTREQIGGYYLIECSDRDDATAWAAGCPGANHGTLEVRPVGEG